MTGRCSVLLTPLLITSCLPSLLPPTLPPIPYRSRPSYSHFDMRIQTTPERRPPHHASTPTAVFTSTPLPYPYIPCLCPSPNHTPNPATIHIPFVPAPCCRITPLPTPSPSPLSLHPTPIPHNSLRQPPRPLDDCPGLSGRRKDLSGASTCSSNFTIIAFFSSFF